MRALALALIVALTWAPPVAAEDGANSRIALPHASLSFLPEAGWTLTQFEGAVFALEKSGARIWAYEGQRGGNVTKRVQRVASRVGGRNAQAKSWTLRGVQDASRFWYEENGEQRMLGAFARHNDSSMDVEVLVPAGKPALLAEARKICDSFDANPFVHPNRVVHWSQEWTLDSAPGWRVETSQKGWARLKHAGRFEAFVGDGKPAILDMLKARRFRDFDFVSVKPGGGKPAAPPAGFERSIALRPKKKDDTGWWIWHYVVGGLDAVLLYPFDSDKQVAEAGKKMLRTLRKGTDPGKQRDVAEERSPTRFARPDGPPIRFKLPPLWQLQDPTNDMRLAHVVIPDKKPLTCIVYWFGAGQGGNAAMNMARWAGQFETEEEPAKPETEDVAEGIRATTMDISGTYVARVRPTSKERVNKPGQRMLATVLEVPQGPVFLKLVGDQASIARAAPAYRRWVQSFRVAKK